MSGWCVGGLFLFSGSDWSCLGLFFGAGAGGALIVVVGVLSFGYAMEEVDTAATVAIL